MTIAIRTDHLTKFYGKKRGLEDLTLEVLAGEVFGYLGPNGAGKTTTIRMLLDFIRPTRGRAEVLGLDAQADSVAIRRRVGYLAGELALYDQLTGRELLTYLGNLRGGVDWGYVEELARRFELDLTRPVRTLSKGNKQKVGLVQAFIHQPELLILDEPTSGLDPLVQQTFYELVKEIRAAGRTVFLSSHVMAEVEHVCDRVGIVRGGRLVLVDHVRELKARSVRRIEMQFAQPVPSEPFEQLEGVSGLSVANSTLRCTVTGPVDALIKTAARYPMTTITSSEPDLEEIFLTYYRGDEQPGGEQDAEQRI